MSTAEIIVFGGGQAVKLPAEFSFATATVSIRRDGDAVILEPAKPEKAIAESWPAGFFDAIHIADPNFTRPEQGCTPPAPDLD